MKNKYFIFLFIASIILIAICCKKKECRNISLSNIECDSNYDNFSDSVFFISVNSGPDNIIIKDSITYDSIYNFTRPFGYVNFNEVIIIGIKRVTNPCSEMYYNKLLCKNITEKKIKLKVHYTLYDQCKGSKISIKRFDVFARIPKIYNDYNIEFEITDINPFPY